MPPCPRLSILAGLLVAALFLVSALTTACGALATASSASSQQVTVKALDSMRFEPSTLTVPVGQPVQLTLANDGVPIHDIVMHEGVAEPVKIEANGKSSVSGTFAIARPGTYTYICGQPGHEAAGMKGTIVAR